MRMRMIPRNLPSYCDMGIRWKNADGRVLETVMQFIDVPLVTVTQLGEALWLLVVVCKTQLVAQAG